MPSITVSNRSSSNVTSISGSINATVNSNGSTSNGAVTIVTPIGENSEFQNLFQPGGSRSEVGFSASVSVDNLSITTDDLLDLPSIELNLDQVLDPVDEPLPEPSPEPEPDDSQDIIFNPSNDGLEVNVSITDEILTESISDSISGQISVTSPGDTEGTTSVEVSTGGTTTETTLPGSSLSIGIVGNADDYLIGTDEPDLLFGSEGNDTVESGPGNDTLWGGKGDDLLMGEDGDDVLIGDLGNDTLTGGAGADSYVLNATTVTEADFGDVITDFNPAEGDQILVMGDLLLETLAFEVIDLDGDGIVDGTLIRLDNTFNDGVLGIVLGSVDGAGQTTLGVDSLTLVSES